MGWFMMLDVLAGGLYAGLGGSNRLSLLRSSISIV